MRPVLATLLGFFAASLVPAVAMALLSPLWGELRLRSFLSDFAFYFPFSLVAVIVFGLPTFLLLRRFAPGRWWWVSIVGYALGTVVLIIVGWPPPLNDFFGFVAYGVCGAASALVFWLIWRRSYESGKNRSHPSHLAGGFPFPAISKGLIHKALLFYVALLSGDLVFTQIYLSDSDRVVPTTITDPFVAVENLPIAALLALIALVAFFPLAAHLNLTRIGSVIAGLAIGAWSAILFLPGSAAGILKRSMLTPAQSESVWFSLLFYELIYVVLPIVALLTVRLCEAGVALRQRGTVGVGVQDPSKSYFRILAAAILWPFGPLLFLHVPGGIIPTILLTALWFAICRFVAARRSATIPGAI